MYNTFVQVILNNISKSTDKIYTNGVPDALKSLLMKEKGSELISAEGKILLMH